MPSLILDGRNEFCFLQWFFFPGFIYCVMLLYTVALGQWEHGDDRGKAGRDNKSQVL